MLRPLPMERNEKPPVMPQTVRDGEKWSVEIARLVREVCLAHFHPRWIKQKPKRK